MKDMELEEMRAQINLLKEKLEKQGIVNSHLLQQSMKAKVSQIHRQGWKGVACGLVAIVAFTFNYIMGSLSLPFVIASILLMLFCIIGTWHCHMPLNDKDLMGQDIHTTARAFSLVKRRYNFWLHTSPLPSPSPGFYGSATISSTPPTYPRSLPNLR